MNKDYDQKTFHVLVISNRKLATMKLLISQNKKHFAVEGGINVSCL